MHCFFIQTPNFKFLDLEINFTRQHFIIKSFTWIRFPFTK